MYCPKFHVYFILDHSIGGPDSSFSMDENDFKNMVKSIREAESAIGFIDYTLTEKQIQGKSFSRSLYVVEDIQKGEQFTEKNLKSIRPGFGLHPKHYNEIIGKKATENLEKGTAFEITMFQ